MLIFMGEGGDDSGGEDPYLTTTIGGWGDGDSKFEGVRRTRREVKADVSHGNSDVQGGGRHCINVVAEWHCSSNLIQIERWYYGSGGG
jgi:hypothetical protein